MKLGIVGSGTIVPDFLNACNEVGGITFQAISGTKRSIEAMKKLQQHFGITNVHESYEDLLVDDIDAVYVAVPNHLHYDIAKRALESGHHVFIEKPFASTYAQATELIDLAEANGVIIFEGITNQYLPNYLQAKELLPQLGDIKIVQLNYSQYSRRYDLFKAGTTLPVFDADKSGGAMMDLNVYNVHFIVGIFGKPTDFRYIANVEKGVDTSGILTLEYPTFKCVAIAAKDCASPVAVNVQGDKGYLHSSKPANVFTCFEHGDNSGDKITYELNNGKHRMFYEIEYFVNLLKSGDLEKARELNAHSLIVMDILTVARQQVGMKL
ncbi:MAG: Gfo/Idh/MocA family oxidoreductase [Turicibacter sp.]|nr:Gfo/Idh/MocA family oxidoreductase [Turicibacter sp.]